MLNIYEALSHTELDEDKCFVIYGNLTFDIEQYDLIDRIQDFNYKVNSKFTTAIVSLDFNYRNAYCQELVKLYDKASLTTLVTIGRLIEKC